MMDFWFVTVSNGEDLGTGRIVAICPSAEEAELIALKIQRIKNNPYSVGVCSGQLPLIAISYVDHQILVSA